MSPAGLGQRRLAKCGELGAAFFLHHLPLVSAVCRSKDGEVVWEQVRV